MLNSNFSQMQYGDQYNPKVNYYENYRQPLQQENWPDDFPFNGYPPESGNSKDWHPESAPIGKPQPETNPKLILLSRGSQSDNHGSYPENQ